VYVQSLQEKGASPERVLKEIKNIVESAKSRRPAIEPVFVNVLVTLRFESTSKCPSGVQYLNEFVSAGHELRSLVLLNYDDKFEHYHNFGVPVLNVEDSKNYLAKEEHRGWLIGRVKNHFGWA
jgi:hypothetical protein